VPSKDRKCVLVTEDDHLVIITWARQQGVPVAEVIRDMVVLKRDSIKRRGYMRELRIARGRLRRALRVRAARAPA
jgi:hypothetical protein